MYRSCQFYSLDTTNINCKNKVCSQKVVLLNKLMIKNLKKRKKSVVANLMYGMPELYVDRKGSYAIPAGMVPYTFSIHHGLSNIIKSLIKFNL